MPVSTREGRRVQRRAEREAAQKKAAQREKVRRYSLLGGGLTAILVVAVVVIFFASRQSSSADANLPGTHFDDPVTASGGLYKHVPDTEPVTYAQTPPNHGDHYPTPMPWGAYDTALPEGRFVHNLEHGGIDVLYRPDAPADLVNQLNALVNSLPKEKFGEVKLVVTPYAKATHTINLVAWDWEEDLDAYDFNAIKAFYDAHVDKGPEQIP
ncbi:MAG: DUF3105 domain-containing protein [Chloroflexi bacterium]|nr:DUF3105 domain-containing protein [Chloroflexota bacterium]